MRRLTRKEIIFDQSIPYHIMTRTVEGRKTFDNEGNCFRFIFQMYAANIGSPARNLHRRDITKIAQALLNGEKISEKFIFNQHPPLVHYLSFDLNFDHYHFELVSNFENAIPKLMQKLNGGFAKFFNLKYDRKDNLFKKPYKIIPIQSSFQSDAVLRYINIVNVLDIYQPGWREKGLKDFEGAWKFLNRFQFSSFPDIFGERNSKIIAQKSVLEKYLGEEITINKAEFIKFIKEFLKQKSIFASPLYLE